MLELSLVYKPNHDLILADELVIEVAIFWLHRRDEIIFGIFVCGMFALQHFDSE